MHKLWHKRLPGPPVPVPGCRLPVAGIIGCRLPVAGCSRPGGWRLAATGHRPSRISRISPLATRQCRQPPVLARKQPPVAGSWQTRPPPPDMVLASPLKPNHQYACNAGQGIRLRLRFSLSLSLSRLPLSPPSLSLVLSSSLTSPSVWPRLARSS
jgi:hypothetical protein